jgi:hypothetical protein
VEPTDGDHDGEGEVRKSRNVRQKVAHPSSPRARNAQIIPSGPTLVERGVGPPKLRVVVKDVAYSTYRAVLYYVFPFFAPIARFLTLSSLAVHGPYTFRAIVLLLPLIVFVWDELRGNSKR